MNGGLTALGILIIAGMFVFGNTIFTPQEVEQIKISRGLCEFPVVGALSKAVSSDIAENCKTTTLLGQIFDLEIYIYGLGAFLFLIGLFSSSGKKVIIKEIRAPPRERIIVHTSQNDKHRIGNGEKINFCPNCGKKVPSSGKFCSSCGEKIETL